MTKTAEQFTPTTDEMRWVYVRADRAALSREEYEAEFDRWLAERDAEVVTERDAAVAAIERVRAVAMQHRSVEQHNEMVPVTDIADLIREPSSADYLAALDGAPEPEWEWEYGVNMGWGQNPPMIQWVTDSKDDALADVEGVPRRSLVRRRKAGPWLPVEGENK